MYEKDVSNRNYASRHHLTSSQELGIHVNPGDICYIDYGSEAYKLEMGLQHFGLVLTRERGKIFVVPMTSNERMIEKSQYDPHLYRMPKIGNLRKEGALFLNDAKWINSARVIGVMAHLPCDTLLFAGIKSKVIQIIKGE